MTSKDLGLVLVGALIFGGGAGALAAHFLGPDSGAPQAPDSELTERVKRLELSLDDTQQKLKQAERRRMQLEEKLTHAEIRLAGLTNAASDAASGDDGATTTVIGPDGTVRTTTNGRSSVDAAHRLLEGFEKGAKRRTLGNVSMALSGSLEQFKKAAALRALPEEERWEKARDEVRLTDGQIYEIQSAVEERDTALQAARTTDEVLTDTGTTMKTVKVDHEKMRAAEAAYDKRVDNVLADDQKKTWKDGGYDRAFGSRRRGATVVSLSSGKDGGGASIFISTDIETTETKK